MRPRAVLIGAVTILGVTLALAFNTYAGAEPGPPTRSTDLVTIVQIMEHERDSLEQRLADLREQVSGIEERAAEEAGMAESFGNELEDVRSAAGLVGVRGPGVVVTLGDAESVPPGQDPGACLIHDFDVATVVNALFAAGAEAVAVNDERVVVTTAVRCAGNTILVNSTRLGNPYEIRAIGEPEDLEQALDGDDSIEALFESYPTLYGLRAEVARSDDVVIPAYRGSLRTEEALAPGEGS